MRKRIDNFWCENGLFVIIALIILWVGMGLFMAEYEPRVTIAERVESAINITKSKCGNDENDTPYFGVCMYDKYEEALIREDGEVWDVPIFVNSATIEDGQRCLVKFICVGTGSVHDDYIDSIVDWIE